MLRQDVGRCLRIVPVVRWCALSLLRRTSCRAALMFSLSSLSQRPYVDANHPHRNVSVNVRSDPVTHLMNTMHIHPVDVCKAMKQAFTSKLGKDCSSVDELVNVTAAFAHVKEEALHRLVRTIIQHHNKLRDLPVGPLNAREFAIAITHLETRANMSPFVREPAEGEDTTEEDYETFTRGDMFETERTIEDVPILPLRSRRWPRVRGPGHTVPKSKCPFNRPDSPVLDYRASRLLTRFTSNSGRILPASQTGISSKTQRQVAKCIKRSRQMAIIPYIRRLEHLEYLRSFGRLFWKRTDLQRRHREPFPLRFVGAVDAENAEDVRLQLLLEFILSQTSLVDHLGFQRDPTLPPKEVNCPTSDVLADKTSVDAVVRLWAPTAEREAFTEKEEGMARIMLKYFAELPRHMRDEFALLKVTDGQNIQRQVLRSLPKALAAYARSGGKIKDLRTVWRRLEEQTPLRLMGLLSEPLVQRMPPDEDECAKRIRDTILVLRLRLEEIVAAHLCDGINIQNVPAQILLQRIGTAAGVPHLQNVEFMAKLVECSPATFGSTCSMLPEESKAMNSYLRRLWGALLKLKRLVLRDSTDFWSSLKESGEEGNRATKPAAQAEDNA